MYEGQEGNQHHVSPQVTKRPLKLNLTNLKTGLLLSTWAMFQYEGLLLFIILNYETLSQSRSFPIKFQSESRLRLGTTPLPTPLPTPRLRLTGYT